MSRTAFVSLLVLAVCQLQAAAQTVALPSFHSFSYSGTVEVPAGGTMSLGGNGYSASSRSQRGGLFPGPVARSSTTQAAGAAVTATIIDNREIDRQLLGGTPQEFIARHHQIEAQRDREARGMHTVDRTAEGKALVRHARSLYQQGRYSAARDAYDMAASVLEPTLRDMAIAEMRRAGLR